MTKQQPKGMERIVKASIYSKKGLYAAWKNEAAFRQEIYLLIISTPLAIVLAKTILQFCLLISAVLLVLIVELLNSGLESVVDRISDEHHELSGRAKDMGSAAVLLMLIVCALVWFGVVWQNYFA